MKKPPGTASAPASLTSRLVLSGMTATGLALLLVVLLLTVFGTLTLVFINQPILAVFVGSVVVTGAEALERVAQSRADKGADAEGFADALDLGGAF